MMEFLKKFFAGKPASQRKAYYTFSVKCLRCGEVVSGRVDLDNDLSVEYNEGGDVYHSRKVLMGSGACFQRIEAEFTFSANRSLIERTIRGGEFI